MYKFNIMSGLEGCYMPNYSSGPMLASTRRELMDTLRTELDMLGYPANRIHDFNVRRMWGHIKLWGGSSVHSCCQVHNHELLSIQGLTDAEYDEQIKEQELYG